MKTSLSISIVAVAALIVAQPAQTYGRGGGGGGRSFGSFGGGAHFSGGSRGYSGGGMHYGGGAHYSSGAARFSSGANYQSRGSYVSGPRYTSAGARYTSAARYRNPTYSNINGRQWAGNRTGTYAGNRAGALAAGNRTTAYNSLARTRNGANLTNGARSRGFNPNGQNVIARHGANAHPNWNRHTDHHWHGHTCHFFNGFWYIYDPFPWYGYGYPYGYDYYPYETYYDPGYEQGAYSDEPPPQDSKDHQYSQEQNHQSSRDTGQYWQSPSVDGSQVTEIQRALAREGYYDGAIDGVLGAGTRRALRNYQRDHNLDVSGGISQPLIEALRLR